jgi:hypothetical protein
MELQDVSCGSVDWIELVHFEESWRALVNAVMKFRVSQNAGMFLDWLRTSQLLKK